MDPDATLADLRYHVTEWMLSDSVNHSSEYEELLGLFQALDNWITQGGFLPMSWERAGKEDKR